MKLLYVYRWLTALIPKWNLQALPWIPISGKWGAEGKGFCLPAWLVGFPEAPNRLCWKQDGGPDGSFGLVLQGHMLLCSVMLLLLCVYTAPSVCMVFYRQQNIGQVLHLSSINWFNSFKNKKLSNHPWPFSLLVNSMLIVYCMAMLSPFVSLFWRWWVGDFGNALFEIFIRQEQWYFISNSRRDKYDISNISMFKA